MDSNEEKVLNGLKWCIKATRARQCVFELTECPYVVDCRKHGKATLLEDASILIRQLLNRTGGNVTTEITCIHCGRKVTTMFCRGCGRMVNWENDEG